MSKMPRPLSQRFSSPRLVPVLYGVSSLFFVIGFDRFFFSGNTAGLESTFNFLLLFAGFFLQWRAKEIPRYTRAVSLCFALLFSTALVVGKVVNDSNRIYALFLPVRNLLFTILSILGFTAVLGAACAIGAHWLQRQDNRSAGTTGRLWALFRCKHVFFLLWGLIFLSWIPCLLAYYPGIFTYDMVPQTRQAVGGFTAYNRYHPPLHTFIWQLCLMLYHKFGIEAVTIYAVIQMLLLSAACASVVVFLIRRRANNWLVLGSLLFFSGVNPVMPILSLVTTKDIYLSVFFLPVVVNLCRLVTNPEKFLHTPKQCAALGLELLLCCLLRNNAVYVFILCIPVAVLLLQKYWKRLLVLMVLPICCFYFINGFVYDCLGIAEGNSREMLSVPMQQIANVVVTESGSLSEEDKAAIDVYIPYDTIEEKYNPRFADPIKLTFQTEAFNANKLGFIKLWFGLFLRYPDNYISAFLSLNLPYWYPDASALDAYSQRKYITTSMVNSDFYTFQLDSKLPWLYKFYETAASYKLFQNVPLVSTFYSLSMPIWLTLFTAFLLVVRKRFRELLVLCPSLFLWLTYMAGPVSNFRYIIPLFLLYPLLAACGFQPGRVFGNAAKKS